MGLGTPSNEEQATGNRQQKQEKATGNRQQEEEKPGFGNQVSLSATVLASPARVRQSRRGRPKKLSEIHHWSFDGCADWPGIARMAWG